MHCRQKATKENEKPEVTVHPKEEAERSQPFEERVDSPQNNLPPLKKKREDDPGRDRRDRHSDRDRHDRDHDRYDDRGERPRSIPCRGGREFVRGRGASRGRGRGSLRGGYGSRGSRGKDYYSSSYDRGGPGSGRSDRQSSRPPQKSDDAEENNQDYDNVPSRHRHGPAGNQSDAPADDAHRAFSESTVNDTPHKESETEKDQTTRESKDIRLQGQRSSDSGERNHGTDQGRDMKSSREHRSAWNQEQKPHQSASIPQNAWTKNRPLLPDPPKSEWAPNESAHKDERVLKVDVWQSQDSRESGAGKAPGENHTSEQFDKHHGGNHRDNRDNYRRQDRDGGGGGGGRRRGDRDRIRSDNIDGEHKDRTDRDRYREKRVDRDHQDGRQDEQNGMFFPRGEPSRRGRGKVFSPHCKVFFIWGIL